MTYVHTGKNDQMKYTPKCQHMVEFITETHVNGFSDAKWSITNKKEQTVKFSYWTAK